MSVYSDPLTALPTVVRFSKLRRKVTENEIWWV